MSLTPREERNPFEAPSAQIGGDVAEIGGPDSGDELIRRAHLSHEASVKSLGWLYYFSSVFFGLIAIFVFLGASGSFDFPNVPAGFTPESFRILLGVLGVAALIGAAIFGAIGHGLRKLQPWARWTVVVLMGLNFLSTAIQIAVIGARDGAEAMAPAIGGALIGSLIPFYIFYLVASAKAGVVFSRSYKGVIARTPDIKYKTSIIVKIFLVFLLVVLAFLVIAGITAALRR